MPVASAKTTEHMKDRDLRSSSPQWMLALHAIVIGIDEYQTVPKLSGAVSDANSIDHYLRKDLSIPPTQIVNLRNHEASRSAIIRSFRALQSNADIKPFDPIVIYYAGHGSEVATPEGRNIDGSKTQCIVPQDVGQTDAEGHVICPIPDYTLCALLYDLSEAKGNNITVVFDCCHSASSTRGVFNAYKLPLMENIQLLVSLRDGPSCMDESFSRCSPQLSIQDPPKSAGARYVPPSSLPSLHDHLDADILSRSAADIDPTSLFYPTSCADSGSHDPFKRGMRSHVLLAACGHGETAFERPNGRGGYFTAKLLHILRSNKIEKLTYKSCMERFPHLDTPEPQNPVCEGEHINRFLFNASVPGAHRSFIPIIRHGLDYMLKAGLAQGITLDSKLALHTGNTLGPENPAIVTFEVSPSFEPAWQSFCYLSPDLRLGQTCMYGRVIEPHGRPDDLKIYPDKVFLQILSDRSQLLDPAQGQVRWVDSKDGADIVLGIDHDTNHVTIAIRLIGDPEHWVLPYTLLPDAGNIRRILSAMANWRWHVSRTSHPDPEERPFSEQLRLEFHRRGKLNKLNPNLSSDTPAGTSNALHENLNQSGVASIVASSEEYYGLRITNDTSRQLYAYPFYFSSANQSIRPLFLKIHGSAQVDRVLDVESEMTVGCEEDDLLPLSFQLGQKVQSDIGFLRVFVTTSPADFESVAQPSPFAALGCAGPEQDEFLDGIWMGPTRVPRVGTLSQVVVPPHAVTGDLAIEPKLSLFMQKASDTAGAFLSSNDGFMAESPRDEFPIMLAPSSHDGEVPNLELWDVVDMRVNIRPREE